MWTGEVIVCFRPLQTPLPKGDGRAREGFETFSLCIDGMDHADEITLIDKKLKAGEDVADQYRLPSPGGTGP